MGSGVVYCDSTVHIVRTVDVVRIVVLMVIVC